MTGLILFYGFDSQFDSGICIGLAIHEVGTEKTVRYLECWCHTRQALRRFSLDAIESVKILGSAAKAVSAKQLDEAFSGSYGIYGGKPTHLAVLRFSIHASRWVSNEEWHPDQVGEFDAEGRYILKIPYADPTELMMDILRQGQHVEVLKPVALRREIQKEAGLIMAAYK